MSFALTKSDVERILRSAQEYRWSLQGFGMLRTYLPDDVRLHVWDSRFAVPNVSLIHDHPWSFQSRVIAGRVCNVRYSPASDVLNDPSRETFKVKTIRPGVGLHDLSEESLIHLRRSESEWYGEGESYSQRPDELHTSLPEPGTVTLVKRERRGADTARVCWPFGGRWISGEPRDATPAEVELMVGYSLYRWFQPESAHAD